VFRQTGHEEAMGEYLARASLLSVVAPPLRANVTLNLTSSFQRALVHGDLYKDTFGVLAKANGLGYIAWLAGNPFDNFSKSRQIKCPAMIIHGTADEVIPYAMGKTLYDAINTEKEMITIDGGTHNRLEFHNPQSYWESLQGFIVKKTGYIAPPPPGVMLVKQITPQQEVKPKPKTESKPKIQTAKKQTKKSRRRHK
jgi:pimeloyl-ACP methyl ester carboxylesterase